MIAIRRALVVMIFAQRSKLILALTVCLAILSIASNVVCLAQPIQDPAKTELPRESTIENVKSVEQVKPIEDPARQDVLFVPVTFREKTAFKLFYQNAEDHEKFQQRASEASIALERAITAPSPTEPGSELVEIKIKDSHVAEIRVRGYKVIDLDRSNQQASGYDSFKEYQDHLRAELETVVADELDRIKIQRRALQFFLSIFFALIGFVALRQVNKGFNKAERILERRKSSFQPVVFLSETLISSQVLGGLLAFSLAIGRLLAYAIIILSTVMAILGQFASARMIIGSFFSQLLTQMVGGLQSLLEAIPGLLLGLLLIFVFQVSLKVLDLFLKGTWSGQISFSFLNENRIPIVRLWGMTILVLLFFPLIFASIFGRFHTPLELVFLFAIFVLALATLPLLVSMMAGSFVLWQGIIQPGQWIEVAGQSGKILDISLFKVTIAAETGGQVHIPTLLFLFKSCIEKQPPQIEFHLRIQRKEPLKNTKALLESLFPQIEMQIFCLSMSAEEYLFALRISSFGRDTRDKVLELLSEAHETGKIQLTGDLIKEVHH